MAPNKETLEISPAATGIRRRDFLVRAGGTVIAASAFGSLLAACGSSSSDSGGGVGGGLTMLSWEGYQGKGVVDPWFKKNDVQVTENLLSSNEEVLTKLKAGGLGTIDLASPNVAYVPQLVSADLLQPIDVERIPNLKKMLPVIDETARQSSEIHGELYAVPFMWGFDGMVYNASQISSAPTDWMDVMDPKYQGKVLMMSGAFPNFEIWPRVLGFDPATLTQDQLDQVTDFLIELKTTQVRTVSSDMADMADLMARGDTWISGSGIWVGLPSIAPKGDKVAFTMPAKGGGTTWIDTWVIPKDAPNLDTTYAYINEMLSTPVQTEMADALGMGTTNAASAKQVSAANRKQYGYKASEIGTDIAPLFRFPEEGKGYTTSEDWNEAWNRVQAA